MHCRKRLIRNSAAVLACAAAVLALGAGEYRNDFSADALGMAPKDVQAIGGTFKVVEVDQDKAVELPGEPLDIFGLLYGPAEHAQLDARARVWAESSGRRFPEFGVGLGDVGGFRLMWLPGQKLLELRRGDEVVAARAFPQWKSGTWVWLRLRVVQSPQGRWFVDGKAWPASGEEPVVWHLTRELKEAPSPGRASVWGVPFSGKPIRFDDLTATPLAAAPASKP